MYKKYENTFFPYLKTILFLLHCQLNVKLKSMRIKRVREPNDLVRITFKLRKYTVLTVTILYRCTISKDLNYFRLKDKKNSN
jgi:hypothetical protein